MFFILQLIGKFKELNSHFLPADNRKSFLHQQGENLFAGVSILALKIYYVPYLFY
jgi:hypothetical protein